MRRMYYSIGWGSHMPALMKALSITNGDVLELGSGPYSTPFLHWACFKKRKLVTYESVQKYFDQNKDYKDELHEVIMVEDWDKINIEKPWDVVLIDHTAPRRREEFKRLAHYAKYVVLHDTEPSHDSEYDLNSVYPLYKYRVDFAYCDNPKAPQTSIFSNLVDLKDFKI